MSDNSAIKPQVPRCADFDEDCDGLDHLSCYLYDPAKGRCPFLGEDPARPVRESAERVDG